MKKDSNRQPGDEWKTVVARNFDEIESIRPIWEQMQQNESQPVPNADIDRYISVVKASGDDVRPHVMLMKHNDQPAVMIISRLEKRQLELKLGYRVLFKPRLRCLTIVYGGILGQPKGDLCSLLVSELMKQLQSREVDMVYFNHLRIDSKIYQYARKMPLLLTRGYIPRIENHWEISIPENMASYYQRFSGRRRSELNRYIRKLERTHSVKVVCYEQEEDLPHAMSQMQEISTKTYQHGMSAGFICNAQTRSVLHMAAARNWLKAHILFIDSKPVAFQVGFQYGSTYFADQIGFDPSWKRYRVGTVLLLKVIEELCTDRSVDKFDFGFGDANYKQLYCDRFWTDVSFPFFAPRLYPIFINMLRTCIEALNAGLGYIVNKIGTLGWIKRRWRNLLQAKNPSSKGGVGR